MGRFGAYGKIPAQGDFLRLGGLGPDFITPWDHWLQHSLAQTRQILAERWQAAYFSAPIWRFTLSPGIAGPSAAQGVLMASVDRVGRQFPLTLARSLPGMPQISQLHSNSTDLFLALEDLALDALEDGMTRDILLGRLAALDRPPPANPLPAHAGQMRPAGEWSALLPDRPLHLACAHLPGPDLLAQMLAPSSEVRS